MLLLMHALASCTVPDYKVCHTDSGVLLFVGFLRLRMVLVPLVLHRGIFPFCGLLVQLPVAFGVRAGLLGGV